MFARKLNSNYNKKNTKQILINKLVNKYEINTNKLKMLIKTIIVFQYY